MNISTFFRLGENLNLDKKTLKLFKKRISFVNCKIIKNNLSFDEKILKKKVLRSKKLLNINVVKKLIL